MAWILIGSIPVRFRARLIPRHKIEQEILTYRMHVGAPDIPGIPAGSPEDGSNYLEFLRLVRATLPSDLELGIAAPASYWYLRGFPIEEIGEIVDYIVYMTYDLHGQWDYGNAHAT